MPCVQSAPWSAPPSWAGWPACVWAWTSVLVRTVNSPSSVLPRYWTTPSEWTVASAVVQLHDQLTVAPVTLVLSDFGGMVRIGRRGRLAPPGRKWVVRANRCDPLSCRPAPPALRGGLHPRQQLSHPWHERRKLPFSRLDLILGSDFACSPPWSLLVSGHGVHLQIEGPPVT